MWSKLAADSTKRSNRYSDTDVMNEVTMPLPTAWTNSDEPSKNSFTPCASPWRSAYFHTPLSYTIFSRK